MRHEPAERERVAPRVEASRRARQPPVRSPLPVARRLMVGAVDDPAERDADRIADDVLRYVRASPGAVDLAAAGGRLGASRIRRTAATPRGEAVGRGTVDVGRIRRAGAASGPEVGPSGGEISGSTVQRIRQMSGRGAPVAENVRGPLEDAFGADFSSVVVHDGSPLAPQLGATAFTLGHDVHFAPGAYDPRSADGLHLLAHELAHVVQQEGASRSGSARRSTIYRHASFEHLMLGQVNPLQLRSIADQRTALRLDDGAQALDLKQETAYHVLRQERERLRLWQASEPKALADVDPAWQVQAVEITSRTPSAEARKTTVCTYGEMNMLADYFGSPEEVYAAEADTLWKLLQTERAEYYDKLGEMLDELMARDFVVKQEQTKGWFGGTSTVDVKWYLPENAPVKDHYDPADYTVREGSSRLRTQEFEGDQRHGVAKADLISMNGLENFVGTAGLLPGDEGLTNFYGPGRGTGTAWGVTARNACHFAPESWRSWETFHRKAIDLAADAGRLRATASAPGTSPRERELWLQRADQLANDAWVHNGFADHYLQDSFASGHLINKTLVMQWYMAEIDTWTSGPSQDLWNRLVMMSAGRQPGLGTPSYDKSPGIAARNPQASANAATTAEAWAASGLQSVALTPDAQTALGQLRAAAGVARTAAEWAAGCGMTLEPMRAALRELVDGDYAEIVDASAPGQPAQVQLAERWAPQGGATASSDGASAARTVTARLYHEWLQNALIQAGAGALHDHFCKQGLWVTTGAGQRVFKIYGDDRMLSAGAGEGVQFAAETAQMSQDSIRTVLNNGRAEPGLLGIERILDRFPSHVVPQFANATDVYKAKDFGLDQFSPPNAAPIPLADWHTHLKTYLKGGYLKSLFSTWSHHFASQTSDLVTFDLVSPHAGAEF